MYFKLDCHSARPVGLILLLLIVLVAHRAAHAAAPATMSIDVPASAVLVGAATARAHWPDKILSEPTEDGQFEILVQKNQLQTIAAPHCRSPWLLIRMPAVLQPTDDNSHLLPRTAANLHALHSNIGLYDSIRDAVAQGRQISLTVTPLSYGHRTPAGLAIDQCNLFFAGAQS